MAKFSPATTHTHGGDGRAGLPDHIHHLGAFTELHLHDMASGHAATSELVDAHAIIHDLERQCRELKHKVRSLEGAKLLWEITRMSMEFQAIKDLDETHRLRSALEDELILAKHRARHFEQEHAKLVQANTEKDLRFAELEAKLQLLGDTSLIEKRIADLEKQVSELDESNKEHEVREGELLDLLDRQEMRDMERQFAKQSSRGLLVREIKQELWSKVKNPAGWLRVGKNKAFGASRDITSTFPDLELLDLLKREVPKLNMRPQYNRHSIT